MPRSLHVGLVSLYALENNGVRHVAASLREAGFRVTEVYFKDWVNNRFPWPREEEVLALVDLLRRRGVDVVGLSVRASAFHRMAVFLTDRIRHALRVPVVWGGMHPTFLPERAIRHADIVAVGEVDLAVRDLFDRMDRGVDHRRVPGFWVREGEVVHRNDVALLPDVDALPFRDYHTWDDKFYVDGGRVRQGDPFIDNPEYTILASRGCPYWTCTFCSNTVTHPLYEGKGPRFRVRSVESVVREVEYARRLCRNIRVVRFDDEVFPLARDWIEEFADKWASRVGIPFEVLVDPRMVREEPLRRLAEAGLRAVCMGVQADERVNREFYNRNTTNRQVVQAQRIFRRIGVRSNLQVIWDDPYSTEEDKDRLFRLLMELERPFELFLFGLTIYPETHLARRLLREGRISPSHVEGIGTHAFEQFRVDLSYPRPPEDRRWLALLVLVNKLPRPLLWKLYEDDRFRRDPRPLVALAQAVNAVKMAGVVAEMTWKGEMTPLLVRRWLNPESLITM